MHVSRGQASLEFFFTISLFLLLLFWVNNFLDTASIQKQDMLLKQRESIAANLVRAANTACILEEEITLPTPCLLTGGKHQPYTLAFEAQRVRVDNVTRTTACRLESTVRVIDICNRPVCLQKAGSFIRMLEAACP